MKPRIENLGRGIKHPKLQGIYEWFASHKRYLFAGLLLFSLFVIFTEQVTAFLVVLVFAIASSTITVYKRFVRMPPVLELISITTAMVTLFFGPIVGIIYTITVNLASEVFSGYPDVMTLTYIPSRTVQVLFIWIASGTTDLGVVALGIWSVIVFNFVQQPVFMFLTDTEQRLKALYFIALNIPINILIFRFLGVPLYQLLEAIL
ncbi:hypothetical protein HYX10_02755 [Candidatus Woesearchaeota archaeon]|nr:hypothetical protein [Candidatus Woesearchaeota archaeon]